MKLRMPFRRAKHQLTDLVIDRVDRVERGANSGAKMVLFKRHPDVEKRIDGQLTVDEKRDALTGALRKRFGPRLYVRDFVDDQVVYVVHSEDGPSNQFLLGYSMSGDEADLADEDPTEVEVRFDYVAKRTIPRSKRATLAKEGKAIPVRNDDGDIVDGRFPIETTGDLSNAVQAFGRTRPGDRKQVARHIMKRARALGALDTIGEDSTIRALAKADKEGAGMPEDTKERDEVLAGLPDEAKALFDTLTKELEDVTAERDALAEDDGGGGDGGAPIDKTELPEGVRKEVERLEKERAEDRDRIEKMERDRRRRDHRDSVIKEMPKLADTQPVDDLADLMLAAEDALEAEQYKSLRRLLKAADASIDTTVLFAELGEGGDGAPTSAGEFDEKVAELVKAGTPRDKAISQVAKEHPDLAKAKAGREET